MKRLFARIGDWFDGRTGYRAGLKSALDEEVLGGARFAADAVADDRCHRHSSHWMPRMANHKRDRLINGEATNITTARHMSRPDAACVSDACSPDA